LKFDANFLTIKIADLSSDLVLEGSFNLTLTLDDGINSSVYQIELEIHPVGTHIGDTEGHGESASNSTQTQQGSQQDPNSSTKEQELAEERR